MKKYLLTFLMVVATASFFTACGSKDSGGGSSGTTPNNCYTGYAGGYNTANCAAIACQQPGYTNNGAGYCCPTGASNIAQCIPANNGMYGNQYGGQYPGSYYYGNYYGSTNGYGYYYGQPYYGNYYPGYYGNGQGYVSLSVGGSF